jgi:hypothetical protein
VLYNISGVKPIFQIDIKELGHAWASLCKYLAPENVKRQEFKLCKDFGLHIKRLGFGDMDSQYFPGLPVPFIAHIEKDKYTFSAALQLDEENTYVASFDFSPELVPQLVGKIPQEAVDVLSQPYDNAINKVVFGDGYVHLTVECKLGDVMEENEDEIYLPLIVKRFV